MPINHNYREERGNYFHEDEHHPKHSMAKSHSDLERKGSNSANVNSYTRINYSKSKKINTIHTKAAIA